MKSLLVTGFGPFAGVDDNPSSQLARELAIWVGADVAILPVHWDQVAAWTKRPRRYARILHLGVNTAASVPKYELFGHRSTSEREGVDGSLWPGGLAIGRGPETLGATFLTPDELEGLGMATSYTPGDYLCNFILYRSLWYARGAKVGFVHVPPFAAMDAAAQLAALVALLEGSEGPGSANGLSSGTSTSSVISIN